MIGNVSNNPENSWEDINIDQSAFNGSYDEVVIGEGELSNQICVIDTPENRADIELIEGFKTARAKTLTACGATFCILGAASGLATQATSLAHGIALPLWGLGSVAVGTGVLAAVAGAFCWGHCKVISEMNDANERLNLEAFHLSQKRHPILYEAIVNQPGLITEELVRD